MENHPKVERKNYGASQQIFTISSVVTNVRDLQGFFYSNSELQEICIKVKLQWAIRSIPGGAPAPPGVPRCRHPTQWATSASTSLRSKLAFIRVQLNLDHNSTNSTLKQIPSCSINQNLHFEHTKENTFGAKQPLGLNYYTN